MTMYRTDRLNLRPGRMEDAPALFRAIADPDIVRNLASAPWPYSPADAERLASGTFNPKEPRLFIFRADAGTEELIGVAGLDRMPDGDVELGYWIAKEHWNRGYASEAGRTMIGIARTELKLPRLVAGYFVDNPASGHVLKKLGFVPVPGLVDRNSRARGGVAACQICTLDL
ncbi:MAG: GNAT family N-acetyltransferase [Caulobacteraceae bacterium]|nr:GNAT family N-acetyltransferase [Caulobacteraceae bacterium]